MRASRILFLARTMRCASVGAGVRKALAISSVVSPHTSRSVSATCASGAIAGWQQVKMRRRRSSSISSLSFSSASTDSRNSSSTETMRDSLRILSMALNRPAETSHARGLSGRPSFGHCSSAARKASASASSARSKSPSRRNSVANTRRDSLRYSSSMVLESETPRLRNVPPPVGRVQAVAAHGLAGGGRVHEPAVAQVNPHMVVLLAFLVEEDQVAAAQLARRDDLGAEALLLGVARQPHARLPVAVLHQAAAIEARGGRAAVAVGLADHLCSKRCSGIRRGGLFLRNRRGGATGEEKEGEERGSHTLYCAVSRS